uniref:Uncharacterized protein n=1 Tax=Strigamia maritima TaxID=126957 RepID=T1JP72_STRMM
MALSCSLIFMAETYEKARNQIQTRIRAIYYQSAFFRRHLQLTDSWCPILQSFYTAQIIWIRHFVAIAYRTVDSYIKFTCSHKEVRSTAQ